MTTENLKPDLIRDEGKKYFPYKDTMGNYTIGVGHNMVVDPSMRPGTALFVQYQRKGIDDDTIDFLLDDDIATAEKKLNQLIPWWRQLSDIRQDVMINMAFNLGADKLATWHHTLGDIEAGNFKAAEIDLENDQPWASQVKERAQRLALQMETDEHQQ